MARILIVTPAPPESRTGNRVTANRWARLLRQSGHRVRIVERFSGQPSDLMIALHARKSAASVAAYSAQCPGRPIILTLTGTDLYGDIRHNAAAQQSLQTATRLVLLQPEGMAELPPHLRQKTRVILQSAASPKSKPAALQNVFEVCVAGHLRPVKDPFRAAMASRLLPQDSRIRVTHFGAALTPAMEHRAQKEMQNNPRYVWLGEVPHSQARRYLARSRVLVLTSKLEGGANVVSEALAADVPVISSRISGSIGLLGDAYPGFFDVGNTRQLTSLLLRAEQEAEFYDELRSQCRSAAVGLTPEAERAAWQTLLAEFVS